MKESKRERKHSRLDVVREMQPQCKRHIAAEEIRNLLILTIDQNGCSNRFVVRMDDAAKRVAVLSVTGQLLMYIYVHIDYLDFHKSVDAPGERIENLFAAKKIMCQKMTEMIGWYMELKVDADVRR